MENIFRKAFTTHFGIHFSKPIFKIRILQQSYTHSALPT